MSERPLRGGHVGGSAAEDAAAPCGAPSPQEPAVQPALGRRVRAGFGWMTGATAASKVLSLLAQIALGRLLLQDEFGVFAVALSISWFAQTFRDGGVRQILIQRGIEGYKEFVGPIFWISLAFNSGVALLMAAAAPLAVVAYDDDRLLNLLLVMALAMPLHTPGSILQARLWSEMRYGAVGAVVLVASVVRFGGMVLLAWLGFGAMSFAIPMVAVALANWLVAQMFVWDFPWMRPAHLRRWPTILHQAKWVMLGALGTAMQTSGDYFVLGLIFSKSVVGVYYFAYQLTAQIYLMLAMNFQQVLFPAFARLRNEPDRQRQAVLRALRVLVLAASLTSFALAVVIGPLEQLLWEGKWAAAVPAVQILALFFPIRILTGVVNALLMGQGRFRYWSMLSTILGAGVLLAALACRPLADDAAEIALVIGVYLAVGSLTLTWLALRAIGVGLGATLAGVLPAWAGLGLCAAATLAAGRWLIPEMHPALEVLSQAALFALLSTLALRFAMPRRLEEILAALPGPLARPARALLRLWPAPRDAEPPVVRLRTPDEPPAAGGI